MVVKTQMMKTENIRSNVREFICNCFVLPEGPGSLVDDDSLLKKGIIDSTGVLELVMFIEETFGIEVGDDDIVPENLDSVNNVTEYVRSKIDVAA